MIVHFVDIDQLSVIIIQYQPARHRQVVLTTPIPPLRNQAYYQHLALVLVKPIIVHTVFWLWTVFSSHSTLSSLSFTPVSDNFIQILSVPDKHWILVFQRKFEQINICDSLVTNGKFPQSVVKSISRIANFQVLFFNYVFFQFNS